MKKIKINLEKKNIDELGEFIIEKINKYDEIEWIIDIGDVKKYNLDEIGTKIKNNVDNLNKPEEEIKLELVEKMKFVAEIFKGLGYKNVY